MAWGDEADALLGAPAPAKKRAPAAPVAAAPAPPPGPELPAFRPGSRPVFGAPPAAPPAPDRVAPGGLQSLITGQAPVSGVRAFGQGGVQGLTSGWGDEIAARGDQLVSKVPLVRDAAQALRSTMGGSGLPLDNPDTSYEERRDFYRGLDDKARAQHPKTFFGGELAGGLVQQGVPGASALGPVAGGAVSGAGYSKAGDVGGLAKDTATGAAIGQAGELAGKAIGVGAQKLAAAAPAAADKLIDKALGAEAREQVRKQLWAARDRVNATIKGDPELRRAIGNPGKVLDVSGDRLPKLAKETEAIYTAADATGGGLQPADVLAPLNQIRNDMVKNSVDGTQVRAVDKVIDEFAEGLGKNPSAGAKGQGGPQYLIPAQKIRDWITDRLAPGSRPLDRDSSEAEKAIASMAVKVRDVLEGYVAKNAGPEAAAQLQAVNGKISSYALLGRLAEDSVRKDAQGPGAVTAIARALSGHKAEGVGAAIGYALGGPVGSMVGAGTATAAKKLVPEIVSAAASPAGQAAGRAAPGVAAAGTRALSQPTIDALVSGDPQRRRAAIHHEVFGR